MIESECNLRAGVYKVQTFGTTHQQIGFLHRSVISIRRALHHSLEEFY